MNKKSRMIALILCVSALTAVLGSGCFVNASADSGVNSVNVPKQSEAAVTYISEARPITSEPLGTISPDNTFAKPYGVFIGLNPEDKSRLDGYGTVVIDAAYYSADDIDLMHKAGQKVYTYLNVGSVEKFRSYFKKFKSITLGVYEDWPDERWVDVSKSKWQKFVVKTLAAALVKKHVDGFFIDNTDVYYVYHRKSIYKGLVSIMSGLKKYKLPIVINGGDTFVKELENNNKISLISGVNQESVFTSINFDNDTFGIQNAEDHEYYCEYIEKCKEYGLSVYLLEYATDPSTVEGDIAAYCNKNGFLYYISKSLDLDGQ